MILCFMFTLFCFFDLLVHYKSYDDDDDDDYIDDNDDDDDDDDSICKRTDLA